MKKNSIRLFILSPFLKGDSFEDEFGFVNYYHHHPVNRLLHIIAIPFLIFSLLTITFSIDYRLSLLFYISYCMVIFIFDVKCGLAYLFLFTLLIGPAKLFSSQGTASIVYSLLIFFTALIVQGIGHFQFEKAAPAFRLFEAIFTTPAFLMMYLIIDHNKQFWNDVESETNKWKKLLKK